MTVDVTTKMIDAISRRIIVTIPPSLEVLGPIAVAGQGLSKMALRTVERLAGEIN